MSNKRDHDHPCEHHQAYEQGPTLPFWLCALDDCPGGRDQLPSREDVLAAVGWFFDGPYLNHTDLIDDSPAIVDLWKADRDLSDET